MLSDFATAADAEGKDVVAQVVRIADYRRAAARDKYGKINFADPDMGAGALHDLVATTTTLRSGADSRFLEDQWEDATLDGQDAAAWQRLHAWKEII